MKTIFNYVLILSLLVLLSSCNNSQDNLITNGTNSSDNVPASYTLNLLVVQNLKNTSVVCLDRTFTTGSLCDYIPWESFVTYNYPNSTFQAIYTFTWSGDASQYHCGHYIISGKMDEPIFINGQSSGSITRTKDLSLSPNSDYSFTMGTDIITGGDYKVKK